MLAFLGDRRAGRRIVADALNSCYEGVIAYHACRPEDVTTYYRDGVRPSSSIEIDARAKAIFCTVDGITAEAIDAITAKLGRRDDGRVYAVLDDRHLIAYANHYLIYGSERLQCVAAGLGESWPNVMQELKQHGRPTLFRVALPWEIVTENDFDALARATSGNVASARRGRPIAESWFSFEFSRTLPAAYVLSHEHPKTLADVHDGMKPYKYESGTLA